MSLHQTQEQWEKDWDNFILSLLKQKPKDFVVKDLGMIWIKTLIASSRTEVIKEMIKSFGFIQRYCEGKRGMVQYKKGKWIKLDNILAFLEKEIK